MAMRRGVAFVLALIGHSGSREIQESGLWNINFVEHRYDPAVVDDVARRAAATLAACQAAFQVGMNRIQTLTALAVDTFEELLGEKKHPNVRLGAARTVAEIGIHRPPLPRPHFAA